MIQYKFGSSIAQIVPFIRSPRVPTQQQQELKQEGEFISWKLIKNIAAIEVIKVAVFYCLFDIIAF
jgi:hypothetical protein